MLPYFLISSAMCCVWLFFIGVATHCELDYVCFMRGKKTLIWKKRKMPKNCKTTTRTTRLLKHGASLAVKDIHGGRRPPFFANPIFRRAYVEKRKVPNEAVKAPKKRKLTQVGEQPLWKRFRGGVDGETKFTCNIGARMVQGNFLALFELLGPWCATICSHPSRWLVTTLHGSSCDDSVGVSGWDCAGRDHPRKQTFERFSRERWVCCRCSTTRSYCQDPCVRAWVRSGPCGLFARPFNAPGNGTRRMVWLCGHSCQRGDPCGAHEKKLIDGFISPTLFFHI